MTTAQNSSTTETRAMALAMFAGQVPCSLQFADPSCEQTARWLSYTTHEENTASCDFEEESLLCDEHKGMVQRALSPFWRMWHGIPPTPCTRCGSPVRLDRFEAIR